MTATELVRELRARGVDLIADGDTLRCRPKSALSPEDLHTLKAMKTEVLQALVQPPRSRPAALQCFCCKGQRFWRARSGVVLCARCHPPAGPEFVADWIEPAS